MELGEERDAEAGLELLAQTLCKFNGHPLADILEMLRDEVARHDAEQDDRTVLLVRALSSSGNHEELSRQRQPHYAACRELLEAKWHKMLAGLAAGLGHK